MKSITPIVSVILLVMITIVAAGGAFFFINSNVASLQSQGNLDTYPGMDNSKLNLVSITGSKAIVRNDGSSPVTDLVIFVNGELLNYSLSEPILPGELREINYNSRQSGDDLTIMMIYNDGKTETSTSPASINTPSSGFVEDPDPLNYVPSTSCLETTCNYPNIMFTGTIVTANYSSCACCGDSGLFDIFYNSTNYCSYGGLLFDLDSIAIEDRYNTNVNHTSAKGVCELSGKNWLSYNSTFSLSILQGDTYTPLIWAIAIGDIDGDGDNDIITGDNSNYTYKWINNGTQYFTNSTLGTADYRIVEVKLFDLEEDGDLDFVTIDQNRTLYSWINDGAGSFTKFFSGRPELDSGIPRSMAVFDYEKDGDLDVIVGTSSSIELFENDGLGNLTLGTPLLSYYGNQISSIEIADLNGDNYPDFAVGESDATLQIYINDGEWNYNRQMFPILNAQGTITDLAISDIDNDGDNDIVTADDGNYIYKWINDGTASFTRTVLENTIYFPMYGVSLVDIDGDSYLDIIFNSGSGTYKMLGNGDGSFESYELIEEAGGTVMETGDLDNNGAIDIIMNTGGAISIQTIFHSGLTGAGGPCCEAGDTFTNSTHSCCNGIFQAGSCP